MPYTVRSVERAVQILSVLGEAGQALSLTELAVRAELPQATTLRLLRTLANAGLVKRDNATSRYFLGPTILVLAFDLLKGMELRQAALPHMTALRDVTEETVILAILDEVDVVQVERVESQQTLRTATSVGKRIPAHCTSLGKILLAYADPHTVDEVLQSHPLTSYTPKTITDPDQVRSQLSEVRRSGIALGDREYHEHIRGISAPIFDASGTAVGAICLSGPVHRLTVSRIRSLEQEVKKAAEAISRELGWRANRSRPLPVAGSHQEFTD